MKLGFRLASGLAALLFLSPSPRADEIRLDDVVARATRDLVVRSPYEDSALLEQIHRAQIEATGAQVSLAFPLPAGTRLARGPIRARQALELAPEERIGVVTLTGAELAALLERAAAIFAPYTFEEGRPLLAPGATDSLFVTADGVSYELDLTAPAGKRLVDLSLAGAALEPERRVQVAATETALRRLGLPAPAAGGPALRDALLARLRKLGELDGGCDRNWSVLPDYAATPERAAIDRLTRLGGAPAQEVLRLFPDQPARRGDLAYWLARAYGWREIKLSGAFPDVPDSLEPWLDGLIKRRVIGADERDEFFQPFAAATLPTALNWCEGAARASRYALDGVPERLSFRRGLLAGTELAAREGPAVAADTLTRAELLGLVANVRFPVVRVLETCDFHGAMKPRDKNGRARGGSATLVATLDLLRAENPEGTVLLDGGDAFQGTMISNLAFGRPVVEQMNRLGYAAMAIGNHEFDWSVDTLIRRIDAMRFAALGANILDRASGRRPRWARADTLLVRRGVRVGVFGLAYTGTPTTTDPRNVTALAFGDDSSAAVRLAIDLSRRGAAVVVGLGHVPGVIDSAGNVGGRLGRLARGVRGVDLWLGGHSHTWVDGEVHGIPAIVAASRGEAIGVCDLTIDPVRGRVAERRHRLVTTWCDAVTPDSATAAAVERWDRAVAREAEAPVGRSARRLEIHRGGESPIGSLVADVMRARAGADVALTNNGGLRAELPEGPLTRAAVYEVIPFENTIVTLHLTGAELQRVLEEGLAAERVVQVSGIRYRFDLSRPPGRRVTALLDPQDRPLDPARVLAVACNDFMAHGGDELVTLATARDVDDTGVDVRQALEDWIRERSGREGSLDYRGDGRVAREPGSPLPARGD